MGRRSRSNGLTERRARIAEWRRYPRSLLLAVAFVFAVSVVYLARILSAGSSDGDAALGAIRGLAGFEHLGASSAIGLVTRQAGLEHGGWFPLRIFEPAMWYAFPNPVVARAFALALVAASVAAFAGLVGLVTASPSVATSAGIGTLLALQLRKPHDIVLSGTYGLPVAFFAVLASLCAYALFIDVQKRRFFVAAVVLEAVACGMDETALLLVVAFPILDLVRARRLGPGIFMLFVPGIACAIAAARHVEAPASLLWLAGGSGAHARMALQQVVAALPTSYRAFENVVRDGVPAYFYDARFDAIPGIDAAGWLATLAASVAVYVVATRRTGTALKARSLLAVALLGVLLLVVGALVQDALEWRRSLRTGEAFASVYVGCFGFGALFALAVTALRRVRAPSLRAAAPAGLSIAVFAVMYGNARVNERVVELSRNDFETTNLIVSAGTRGIFAALPPHAKIVLDRDTELPGAERHTFRDPKYLFYLASGRRFSIVDTLDARAAARRHDLWVVRRERSGVMGGGLTVARVRRLEDDRYLVDTAFAYHRYPTADMRDRFLDGFREPLRGIRYVGAARPGSDIVAQVRRACGAVPVEDVYLPSDPNVEYGSGFFRPSMYKRWAFFATNALVGSDVAAEQQWRYGAKDARLVIRMAGCAPARLRLRAIAYASGPGRLSIAAPGLLRKMPLDAAGALLDFILPATARERFEVRFVTSAPAAHEDLGFPHFLRDERGPARLVLEKPTIAVAPRASRHG